MTRYCDGRGFGTCVRCGGMVLTGVAVPCKLRTFYVTGVFVSDKPDYWTRESVTATVQAESREDAIAQVNVLALQDGKLFLSADTLD